MSENTTIEWADHTFNPWTGCMKVSPGCDHCYAEGWSKRAGAKVGKWGAGAPRVRTTAANWKLPIKWEAGAEAFQAAHGRRQRVFCASLADVFDNEVDPQWRVDLFALIEATPNLDWLLLTKRIGNVGNMLPVPFDFDKLYPNVWLGATVVNQEEAYRDIPKLLATPAAKRFLSMEPLLGPVNLGSIAISGHGHHEFDPIITVNALKRKPDYPPLPKVDWVIAGGESGPGARPSHPDWYRALRDQCAAAGVPFLFKQWGEWANSEAAALDLNTCYETSKVGGWVEPDGKVSLGETAAPVSAQAAHIFKVGKKAAGRLLDGVTHDGFPS